MTVEYAVTFEFDVQAPVMTRGIVTAGKVQTCVARAVREATKRHPGFRWSSLVVVLLSRVDTSEKEDKVIAHV